MNPFNNDKQLQVVDSHTKHTSAIKKNHVEGECTIKSLRYLKYRWYAPFILLVFFVGTIGIGLLVFYWVTRVRKWLCYNNVQTLKEASHVYVEEWDDEREIVALKYETVALPGGQTKEVLRFKNRYLKYFYDERYQQFEPLHFKDIYLKSYQSLKDTGAQGLTQEAHLANQKQYGRCAILVPSPNPILYFLSEILHPINFFQLFSCAVWIYEEYYYYSYTILFITFCSAAINMAFSVVNQKRIREMAYQTTMLNVLRIVNGQQQKLRINSDDLVPGDLFEIETGINVPCDAVLMNGEAILNESSLTGESIPVVKQPLPKLSDKYLDLVKDKKHILFQGTTVLQSRSYGALTNPLAFVVATGYQTEKGQLIRSILYPKPHKFAFHRDAFIYLLFMFLLSVIGYFIVFYKLVEFLGAEDLVVKFLDGVTTAVPPGLAAALLIGDTFSLWRLKRNDIFCIQPARIQVAGRVDCLCFDKTGTLTEETMDVYGLDLVNSGKFASFHTTSSTAELASYSKDNSIVQATQAMATCHTVQILNMKGADNTYKTELIGDPMEVRMLNFTRFELLQSDSELIDTRYKAPTGMFYVFKKKFEFDSEVQRMSVIVRDPQNDYYLYCKGAPERLKNLCDPSTVPSDYEDRLTSYAEDGYRVLAVAGKKLSNVTNDHLVDNLDREKTENNMNLLGFLVFKNNLKEVTAQYIDEFNKAALPVKMITGDNPATAFNVAKKCHIIKEDHQMVMCDLADGQNGSKHIVVRESFERSAQTSPTLSAHNYKDGKQIQVRYPTIELAVYQTQPVQTAQFLSELLPILTAQNNRKFVFTGASWDAMITKAPANNAAVDQLLKQLIMQCSIFARMHSTQKVEVVTALQKFGFLVGFCGDGANDCGALKAADCGLSLSQAEASMAAPFTAKVQDISSFEYLLREGRCCLSTSFQCFKFMAFYSMTEFTSLIVLYFYFAMLSDFQYLYVDLIIVTTLFTTMAITGPADKLTKDIPPIKLIGLRHFFSTVGALFIQLVMQALVPIALMYQSWYVPSTDEVDPEEPDTITDGMESTVVFLFSTFLYIGSCIAFNVSRPFKETWLKNVLYVLNLVLLIIYTTLIFFVDEASIADFEFRYDIPKSFLAIIFGWSIGTCVLLYVFENVVIAKWLFKSRRE